MQVKMQTQISGTRNGQDWPAKGEIIDLPDDEAKDLIAGGLAEAVDETEPETPAIDETATAPRPPETATRRGRKT